MALLLAQRGGGDGRVRALPRAELLRLLSSASAGSALLRREDMHPLSSSSAESVRVPTSVWWKGVGEGGVRARGDDRCSPPSHACASSPGATSAPHHTEDHAEEALLDEEVGEDGEDGEAGGGGALGEVRARARRTAQV